MKREIKFRAWDKKREQMVSVAMIDFDAKEGYVIVTDEYVWNVDSETGESECQIMLSDCILMQFTGFKDKNGKEVYEGDIRIGKYNVLDRKEEQVAYEVMVWDQKTASFHWDRLKGSIPDFIGVEIIGNIWENPELLKGDYEQK